MSFFGFGKKPDYYNEGYEDGQQYAEEQPNLDIGAFTKAQISAQTMNSDLGLSESQDA